MSDLLFLAHRLPWPPNKGDKIRSYNMLRELAQHFRVHVGCFIDDAHDWNEIDGLRPQVASLHAESLQPKLARLRSATGLLTGEPLSLPYYRQRGMQRWVDACIAEKNIRHVVCFSSVMAQYVMKHNQLARYMDFVDMDSDKWRQYAQHKSFPMSQVYAREGRTLLRAESDIARAFDYSWFVSAAEVASFHAASGIGPDKAGWFGNGVDLEYFRASDQHTSPYPAATPVCVFTGAMDYFANVDAVVWFADQVWPQVRAEMPDAQFWIVGSNPSASVRALAQREGIEVTGRVPDVRPYVQHARCAVAPLRIARGIQNKVLEALAMGKPAICSPAAAEGLQHDAFLAALTVDAPADFAARCLHELRSTAAQPACRAYVEEHYQWQRNLAPLITRLQASAGARR